MAGSTCATVVSRLAHALTTEYESDPIGVAVASPRFSWQLQAEPGEATDGVPSAHEIEVTSSGELVWSSGKVEGNGQVLAPYSGAPLNSRSRCDWRVRVWGKGDTPGPWSSWAHFEVALLAPSDWAGSRWIGPPPPPERSRRDRLARKPTPGANRPSPILRREFELDGGGHEGARLHISALGIYDVAINGQSVSAARLRPGFTAYEHRIQAQTYDVTDLLVNGRNAIGITLADGWWRGRVGVFRRPDNWGSEVAAIARLEVDGELVVETDDSWRLSEGGVRRACLFHGETHDERLEPQGWTSPCFDDSAWARPHLIAGPTERLVPQAGPSVSVIERLPAAAILTTPSGERVVDFGRNVAGVVEFTATGAAGSEVRLTHGETLTADGEFTSDTFGEARQEVRYTLAGRPEGETFAPRFTYHGFRYARIDAWPAGSEPRAEDFTALVLSSECERVGRFDCSHPGLVQLAANIDHSQVGNFVDIPTDCPTREKAGWTGDIAVFARTGALNRQVAPLLSRWLADVRSDQLPDGRIPCVVPVSASYDAFFLKPAHGAAAWADACVDVPWAVHLHYGDRQVLADNFPMMLRWVHALDRRAGRDPWWRTLDVRTRVGRPRPASLSRANARSRARASDLRDAESRRDRNGSTPGADDLAAHRRYLIEQGFQWAEWLPPGETLTRNWLKGLLRPDPLVATAFYARTLGRVAHIADLLDRAADAERCRERRAHVIEATRAVLFEADGLPTRRDQIGLVAALAFDLVDDGHRTAAGDALAQVVRADGSQLATGFTMTPLLCPTLVEAGHAELAYDVLLGTDVPSWLYPLSKGATTIWETWDAIAPDGEVSDVSQNHYAFGAVGEFLHRYVAGLDTDHEQPGYERVIVDPRLDPARRITRAASALETARGRVAVEWEWVDDRLEVEVEIPMGATARVGSGPEAHHVGAGTHRLQLPADIADRMTT